MNQELEMRYKNIDWKKLIASLRKVRHYSKLKLGGKNV